ncbi:MAG: PP2C family protein-serine/threonine phosphatase [Phycisphaeraceae bacterium]
MKIRESLHVAMQVQQSLLPEAPPQIPGLDIAGHSEYCDETGGDYYDFIQLDQLGPDTLAIAVGDVTGHGIAAALLMATGRALIRSNANTNDALGDVFTAVNQQLCGGQFTGRFMTLMYLIVQNPAQCRRDDGCVSVRYLSAGHDPVIVYRPSDDSFHELAGNDIPLGIDPDWSFHEHHADDLRPGDILVVGTDGIWECFNPQGDQFGKTRLREAIRTASPGDAESIAKSITDACACWRGDRDQADDITLVVVKLTG